MPTLPELMSAEDTLGRWLDAVRSRGEGGALEFAVAPEVVVERHHWASKEVAERLEGVEAVRRWLAMSPPRVEWSLERRVWVGEDGVWEAAYGVRVGDFVNTGRWRFRAQKGQIVWLAHQPEDLPEEWRRGVPEGKKL